MRSRDVGHNQSLHSWPCNMYMLHHATSFNNVARLFPKLAESENRTNTSNLRWVYRANARMQMYGHDVQSIIAEIPIKCYKHSQKQLKAPPGEWQCQMQRIQRQTPYRLFSQFYTGAGCLKTRKIVLNLVRSLNYNNKRKENWSKAKTEKWPLAICTNMVVMW